MSQDTMVSRYSNEWVKLFGQGLSISEIAKRYNCTYQWVWKALKRNGIQMRPSKWEKYYDEWARLYVCDKLGTHEIAKLYNCAQTTVRNALVRKGIKLRSYSEAQKGKKHPPEVVAKRTLAVKEAFQNEETKKKHREAVKKALHRKDVNQRLREGIKRAWANPVNRDKHKQAMNRPEVKARLSEATKLAFQDPETRQRIINASTKGKNTPEAKKRFSEVAKRRMANPEIKKRILAKWHHNPKRKAERIEVARRGGVASILSQAKENTSIEKAIAEVLQQLGIEYVAQKPLGPFVVDFFIPRAKLVIECDGDYWHNLPEMKERDKRKDGWLKKQGFRMIRIWEHEIKQNAKKAFLNALERGGLIDLVRSA